MATDQYSVLGEAPTAEELKELSSNDTHFVIFLSYFEVVFEPV